MLLPRKRQPFGPYRAKTITQCLMVLTGLLLNLPAVAQQATQPIYLKPQPVAEALLKLAKQQHIQIVFTPQLVDGIESRQVSGFSSIEAALKQLLSGTELVAVKVAKDAYVIQQKPRSFQQKQNVDNNTEVKAKKVEEPPIERIRIVGTNIRQLTPTQHIPVKVYDKDFVQLSGAASGEELLRYIPQIGEIPFNNERAIGGVNDARGDVSSINLRGLGTGYTLTLLNGRRLVQHPGTQTENYVPVTTVNINTLPINGIERLEILLDGAAAIYGSDAVAGVVNYVMTSPFDKGELAVSHGLSPADGLSQSTVSASSSLEFNQQQSYINFSAWVYRRNGLSASDKNYSYSQDRRFHSDIDPAFIGDTQLDNRSTSTPWLELISPSYSRVHIQPQEVEGCNVDIGQGYCLAPGTVPRELRFDRAPYQSMTSDVERINLYSYLNHHLSSETDLFAEAFYYIASSGREREQAGNLSSQRFLIAADAAANPLNENILLRRYRPIDVGNRNISVDNSSYRFLAGINTLWRDWELEVAGLYSRANTRDIGHNRIQANLFQQAINNPEPSDAYNPFSGFSTQSNNRVAEQFLVDVSRYSKTSLLQWDAKATSDELFTIANNRIAMAGGIEWRRESYSDDRDPLLDGSDPFYDQLNGKFVNFSNVLGSSYTADSGGDRSVFSAFLELQAPISNAILSQWALRYEDYSDVGDVVRPKVAISWQLNKAVTLRGAYSEGYRVPNLPQISEVGVARSNTEFDPVTDTSYAINELRFGNIELKPEQNRNKSLGVTGYGENWSYSIDWWRIEQTDLVGLVPAQTRLLYDSLLRSQGLSDTAFQRDIDNNVTALQNQYINLNPRQISGLDYSVSFGKKTAFGHFKSELNIARLLSFSQQLDPISQLVIDAQQNGIEAVPADVVVENVGELLKINGRPKWRVHLTNQWRFKQWLMALNVNYVSDFYDDSVWNSAGNLLPVDSYLTFDWHGSYQFAEEQQQLSFGIRNLSRNEPPLADESFGYFSDVHSNRGRYAYLKLQWRF